MTQSMTAFARNESALDNIAITLELRSVNHRYLDITIRVPEDVREVEQKLRELLSSKLSRGKVELNIRIQDNSAAATGLDKTTPDKTTPEKSSATDSTNDIQLNMGLVEQLSKASHAIAQHIPNADNINPLEILRWPGVIQAKQMDTTQLQQNVTSCLAQALDEFVETRKREGDKLATMLIARCDDMGKIIEQVEKLIPTILDARKQKIQERLTEFNVDHDENRLEQEMVLLAQKMDVSEELDRLGAHLTEVRNVLSSTKPVGRRLDFLMQELNREANTLGSKSVDTASTRASVDLKVLIEQMREQVQNIE